MSWSAGEFVPPKAQLVHIDGPPGTGKSLVLKSILRSVQSQDQSALLLCPTGALSEAYRLSGVASKVDIFDGGTMCGRVATGVLSRTLLMFNVVGVDELFLSSQTTI